MARQEQQQVELALGQRELLAVDAGRGARAGSISSVAEAQRRLVLGLGGSSAAQHSVDAGDELRGRERLDDVVVGAEPQPDDAVGLLALGRQQDDRGPARAGCSRSRRMTSSPSMPGSITSSTTRSGARSPRGSSAAGPSAATRVS